MFTFLKNRKLMYCCWALLLAITAISITWYYYHASFYPSTDDAYIQANTVRISAQVTGPVTAIYVQNNAFVKKGQLLFTINAKPFQLAVAEAKAHLKTTEQNILAEQAQIAAAKAQLAEAEDNAKVAEQNVPRILTLAKSGKVSQAKAVIARGKLESAKAKVKTARAQFQQAVQQLGATDSANAAVITAKAQLQQAELNLQYCKIYAPASGYITDFKLRPGTVVQQDTPLFALVANKTWWVSANYKETSLSKIKPKQKATITLDSYPDHTFHGYVQSISRGSGASFSLFPPENASGNWVKVTQRFPVKIIIIDPNSQFPLRVGASATVTINTTS